jgi:hypothetical protein
MMTHRTEQAMQLVVGQSPDTAAHNQYGDARATHDQANDGVAFHVVTCVDPLGFISMRENC